MHQSNQKLIKKMSKTLSGGYGWRRLTVNIATVSCKRSVKLKESCEMFVD